MRIFIVGLMFMAVGSGSLLASSAVSANVPVTPKTLGTSSEFLPALDPGNTWKLIWSDDFNGASLDPSKWTHRPDGPRRDGWWSTKAVSLDGQGHLVLSTLRQGNRIITGNIITAGKFQHRFGYYTCRVKFPSQPGYWPTFWLTCDSVLKDGTLGRDGTEIDVFEKPRLGDQIEHNLHWDGYGVMRQCAGHHEQIAGLSQGWHTVGLWWQPAQYIFYVDGKETWRTDAGGVSQVPEYLLMSEEVGAWAGKINPAMLADSLLVDYVRVYDPVPTQPTLATK